MPGTGVGRQDSTSFTSCLVSGLGMKTGGLTGMVILWRYQLPRMDCTGMRASLHCTNLARVVTWSGVRCVAGDLDQSPASTGVWGWDRVQLSRYLADSSGSGTLAAESWAVTWDNTSTREGWVELVEQDNVWVKEEVVEEIV